MLNNITIEHAIPTDIDAITLLYEQVQDYLAAEGQGFTNWKRGVYPLRSDAQQAQQSGELFVVRLDGIVAGTFILNSKTSASYDTIAWGVDVPKEACLVLHTLAVSPAYFKCGIAKLAMAYIETYAVQNDYAAVRLNTKKTNIPGNKLYQRAGYQMMGETIFEPERFPGQYYYFYEKVIRR